MPPQCKLTSSVLRRHARADRYEFQQPVHVLLLRRPSDAAQKNDPVEWIVEGPVVVAGDAAEDPALVSLERPKLGARRVLFDGAGQDAKALFVSVKGPVSFIHELELREAFGDRMIGIGEVQLHVAVAELRHASGEARSEEHTS